MVHTSDERVGANVLYNEFCGSRRFWESHDQAAERCLRAIRCYTQSGTGNGMVGSILIQPAGTGTYLDGLDTGLDTVLVQQSMMNPWYYVR